MLTTQTRSWKAIIYFLFGTVLGIGLGVGYMRMTPIAEKIDINEASAYSKLPREKYVIVIEKSQQQELFNQVRNFADENGFAVRIAPNTPTGEDFSIELWREDIRVFGANPFYPGEFRIGFYDTDGANPYPLSDGALNALVSDFMSYISEIPNATITEEK